MKTNNAPTAPLYKELPYPADGVIRTTVAKTLLRGLKKHAPDFINCQDKYLADVGCGTGEATVGCALQFDNMNVVGIDINPASLLKAEELARTQKTNVKFLQCDIANLENATRTSEFMPLDGKFDLVTSMGVLHHLADPQQGFAAVRKIIKDDGLFLCFVYSRLGRWDDIAVRQILDRAVSKNTSFTKRAELLRLLNISRKHTLSDSVKSLWKRIRFGPPMAPMELMRVYFARNSLTHVSDTFSNPCEHLFYFSDLMRIFANTGWQFVALAEEGGLPITPEQHTRNPEELKFLHQLPSDVLFDYFAYIYRAWGFTFFLRPADFETKANIKS